MANKKNQTNQQKREFRSLNPLEVKEQDENNSIVEGFATTFNKPYEIYEVDGVKYYEVIDRNSLNEADMSDIILQYDHKGKVLARKSNETLVVEPQEDGLFVSADLSKSAEARNLLEEINNGLVTKMSWAFVVDEDEYNRETRTRTIKRIKKVYDVSAVSLPANNDTSIDVRSYFNGVIDIEKRESLARKKKQIELELRLLLNN